MIKDYFQAFLSSLEIPSQKQTEIVSQYNLPRRHSLQIPPERCCRGGHAGIEHDMRHGVLLDSFNLTN